MQVSMRSKEDIITTLKLIQERIEMADGIDFCEVSQFPEIYDVVVEERKGTMVQVPNGWINVKIDLRYFMEIIKEKGEENGRTV